METVQTASHPKDDRHLQDATSPNFETIWAALQKVTERQREITRQQEETDLQIKEINRKIKEITHQKNIDQKAEKDAEQLDEDQLLEEDQEKEEIAKEHQRLLDDVLGETLYFGDVPDYMLLKFLFKKFSKLGLDFTVGQPDYYVSDKDNKISAGADFILKNDDKVMLVKVQKELTSEDVKKHINCLEEIRKYADLHIDNNSLCSINTRAILGTVAGVVVSTDVKEYALGQGLYVMEPHDSGVSFKITPPNVKPKEW
ncbi:MAG: hypothetical protein LBC52_00730 [Treponema sp.]|jgi:hypothetical protein|nr:hypothetical protein [Treponema sp.]